MTIPGGRRLDPKGRPTGRLKGNRNTQIKGQFIAYRLDMLRSPARQVLSLSARRVLERIEIEHCEHAGKENGRLAVTFDDFQTFGIDRHAIAPAMRECVALGFVEITEHGRAGNAEHRAPNRFRLTYLNTFSPAAGPTDDWQHFENVDGATAIASAARKSIPPRHPHAQPALKVVR